MRDRASTGRTEPLETSLEVARAVVPVCTRCSSESLHWYRLADVGASESVPDNHQVRARRLLLAGLLIPRSWYFVCCACHWGDAAFA